MESFFKARVQLRLDQATLPLQALCATHSLEHGLGYRSTGPFYARTGLGLNHYREELRRPVDFTPALGGMSDQAASMSSEITGESPHCGP